MTDGRAERVFVYGTLRRGASREAGVYYSGVSWFATGRIRGWLHDLGAYPGLRLDEEGDWVTGEILEVTPEALRSLDEWEGIPQGTTEGGEYRRVWTHVEREDGDLTGCWVYEVSADHCAGAPILSSGDWLARV